MGLSLRLLRIMSLIGRCNVLGADRARIMKCATPAKTVSTGTIVARIAAAASVQTRTWFAIFAMVKAAGGDACRRLNGARRILCLVGKILIVELSSGFPMMNLVQELKVPDILQMVRCQCRTCESAMFEIPIRIANSG